MLVKSHMEVKCSQCKEVSYSTCRTVTLRNKETGDTRTVGVVCTRCLPTKMQSLGGR